MKQVTLYSTTKQSVMSYDMHTIRQACYSPNFSVTPCRNSDTLFNTQEVQINNLPIERFCWQDDCGGYREVYAAFDQELRELIGCSQEKFKRDVDSSVQLRMKKEHAALMKDSKELNNILNMTFWKKIVWVLKSLGSNK